jgi:hypothetical protein
MVLKRGHIDIIVLAIVDTFEELKDFKVKQVLWLKVLSFLHEICKKIIYIVHSIVLGD